jgi:hypothetical protein
MHPHPKRPTTSGSSRQDAVLQLVANLQHFSPLNENEGDLVNELAVLSQGMSMGGEDNGALSLASGMANLPPERSRERSSRHSSETPSLLLENLSIVSSSRDEDGPLPLPLPRIPLEMPSSERVDSSLTAASATQVGASSASTSASSLGKPLAFSSKRVRTRHDIEGEQHLALQGRAISSPTCASPIAKLPKNRPAAPIPSRMRH